MADKNSSKQHEQTGDAGTSSQFKLLVAVIALGVLGMILKPAGVF